MKLKLKYIVLVLCLSMSVVHATVEDYQVIYQEEQKEFNQQMSQEIKKSVISSSKKVQELYRAINYRPVWVDKDYLTQYAELLVHELKSDFEKGLHPELVATYKKLVPNEEKIFNSESLGDKVVIELGLMNLYVKHIGDILKERKSKHTALSLLQHALKEKSLIHALNAISEERITYRTPMMDSNMTIIQESEKMDMDNITMLKSDDEKERLTAMYDLLNFQPVWITEVGFSTYTKDLFKHIENDITLDRNSDTFKSYLELKAIQVPEDKQKIVAYEFEIAKLYQKYMSHTLYGNIDWKSFQAKLKKKRNADWVVHEVLSSPESLLIEAISHGSLDYAFKEAKPLFPLYDKLLVALKKYQEIVSAGGWQKLPEFRDIELGMKDAVIPAIRERLAIEGDYQPCLENNDTELYDNCLLHAVKKFQARHGLTDAGYIGSMTRKSLMETAEEKVARIRLNLDRMKWVKRSHDRYQIWVNIPGYTMYVFDESELMETMRVIVGRNGHNTPVFYNRVRTIVLNPYWRIPASIIRGEMIPKLKKNRNYTNSKKIEIHTGYSEHSPKVNPHNVNWHKYGRKLPPYKFMQSPGKHNALGKVKYLFPNKYSVYMHDTNQPELFSKDVRSLSHGCVRLHKPVDLLETFSVMDPKIDFEKAQATLEHNKKTPIRLSHSIPVDMIYLTTWVENDGSINFRDDIYGYDKMQILTSK
ncbi:MAG: L,D-transpeptidase family protein [Sulfurovum sp.]|uniref:L,D-transpeptidase family protein n=1 Tax=Sulfurovum sp. TaxID=1969726 RepID=UPI003C75546C